ncbi:phosphomevalonate kinase [Metarhizium album ARSEF 1941]|uniref:Phosphomevalonate kinase n=1 Tax=Metarhizium album (strain ARSEF 1941) TaxID=1081103 RepID=A0A0B2WVK5_METAS|nr:phosphomevalonate kinase [Metarhizium album ARSEF 1941]KHN98098.1 phosphomevalonate kinase [Metarhizium album ARSEF 1941]
MASGNPTVAVSAPGKVLLAGGYLVLDRKHTGVVFGLSARINVVAGEIHTSPGVQLSEIMVDSPQFVGAQWRYGYHLAPQGGGIKVTQLQVDAVICRNAFVETTLSYALTYVDRLMGRLSDYSLRPARLVVLADNDYYSQSTPTDGQPGRFAKFTVPLGGANKTGLGSSAALVTALTAALLSHYLPRRLLDITSAQGKRRLHNLAQAAHCAAQGKVGSGFDVAAAVYGSCLYRRFSPDVLSQLPEAGSPGFAEKLVSTVDGAVWDVEVRTEGLRLPKGVTLSMCDVDCGSQTVGMVKKVLAWRAREVDVSTRLWDELQARNEDLAAWLSDGNVTEIPVAVAKVRALIREMGKLSDVPIEPESQTELLDALSAIDGVYGGVVPGAGGFDALALLTRDDEETKKRVEDRVAQWSREKGDQVRLLGVKGEMEGVKYENLDVYSGWIAVQGTD